jgi:hypothetical protein
MKFGWWQAIIMAELAGRIAHSAEGIGKQQAVNGKRIRGATSTAYHLQVTVHRVVVFSA